MDTPCSSSAIFYKGDNFCDSLSALLLIKFYLKMGTLLKERNSSQGSQFFPFRGDLFSEGRQNYFDRVASPKRVSIPLKREICIFRDALHKVSITEHFVVLHYATVHYQKALRGAS